MITMKTTLGATVKLKASELIGRRVKTRFDLSNGWGTIPAGTWARVDGAWRSYVSLKTEACAHCGVVMFMSKVSRTDVNLDADERDKVVADG